MNKNIPAFLLTPSLIPDGKPIISLIHISKKGKSISYETNELQRQSINKTFKNYSEDFRCLLLKCCIEQLNELSFGLNTRFNQRSAGIEHSPFYSKGFIKHWHKVFEELKPYLDQVKWYYKKEQPGKNALLTSPCSFSQIKPSLSFEVIKLDGVLQLKACITFSETSYPLESFTRNHFLGFMMVF